MAWRTDSIKSRARKEAYTADGSKAKWFNPLTRKISRTRPADEEAPYEDATELPEASTTGVEGPNGPIQRRPSEKEGPEYEGDGQSGTTDDSKPDEEREKEEKDRIRRERWKRYPVMPQVRMVLFPHWYTLNWLLLLAPVGIGLNFSNVQPLAIFLVNFIAIIPLAGLLSFATEEIAEHVGEVLGGILNASFG
jgi:hypothetical protein